MAVYMIRAGLGGDVKIGHAADPLKRLQGLQTSHTAKLRLLRVLEGGRDAEKALHVRFADQRRSGEWFAFAPEMMSKDIGYPDLPIPIRKRDSAHERCAWGRKSDLHIDILYIIGGADALGRRMGLPPWKVTKGGEIVRTFYSASILMLREAGYTHITLTDLHDADWEMDEEHRRLQENAAEIDAKHRQAFEARLEREWIKKRGIAAAWWEVYPENRVGPSSPHHNDNELPSSVTEAAG